MIKGAARLVFTDFIRAAEKCLLWYYRVYDMKEIDLILETGGKRHPIPVKRSINPRPETIRAFKVLDKEH